MVAETNFKINLGLNVVEKLPNGYHALETVFYPVYNQRDSIEIQPSSEFQFQMFGGDFSIDPDKNICVKAFRLLEEKFQLSPISITLTKKIPSGAGIGGGSGDAATTLLLLNQYFDLKLDQIELINIAKKLGSDVPFFIINQPCYATGVGEILTPISLDLSQYRIEMIFSDIQVSTPLAYSWIKPQKSQKPILEILKTPIEYWKHELVNDFESVVFPRFPELERNKQLMYERGAVYAAMSGSGSSIFGLFTAEKV